MANAAAAESRKRNLETEAEFFMSVTGLAVGRDGRTRLK
jgi:hypothetical protein